MGEIYAFDFLSLSRQDPLLQFKEANLPSPAHQHTQYPVKENPLHNIGKHLRDTLLDQFPKAAASRTEAPVIYLRRQSLHSARTE